MIWSIDGTLGLRARRIGQMLLAVLLLWCLQSSHQEPFVDHFAGQYAHYWSQRKDILQLRSLLTPKAEASRMQMNDYAIALVHVGKISQAVELLRTLERENPGEYPTAANLGTALELQGENQEALPWILRILEAKLAMAEDPHWLISHTVLGPDFGDQPSPQLPADWAERRNLEEVIFALEYQLIERLELVRPPDPIVGDLLFALGNLQAFRTSSERAAVVLKLAQKFGTSRPERLAIALNSWKVTP